MEQKNIITKEGLAELKLEMKNLVEIERPKVILEIKDARALGDLSENAEFDAAREKQGQIEDRIQTIEEILGNSKIITKSKSKNVRVGSTVTYQDLSTKDKVTLMIVGSLEADPFENKISNSSPLGVALIGAEEGDIVTVQVAKKYDIKVTTVKN